MAVELEIRDGDPWWLSPDLWVVPGNDPEGTPSVPIAGQPAYMWARVRNNGNSSVANAEIRFYWADPSTAFDRNTAHLVGSSFVTLDPAEVADVLLLVPWIPEYVNGGHECILAEAFHPALDPLPATPAFNVPTDDQVAQRNLSVVLAATGGFFKLNFNSFNTTRTDLAFTLAAEVGRSDQIEALLPTLGRVVDPKVLYGQVKSLGFVDKLCPEEADLKTASEARLEIDIAANRKRNQSLVGLVTGGGALIHVYQHHQQRLVGGLSLIVLPPAGKQRPDNG